MSQFRFEEFNPRRHMRGAEAARVTWVNDQGEEDTLWMSPADIRGNVLQHGPHYGLLVAASHYHMKADQLVALHRSKGKNKTFLQPMAGTVSLTEDEWNAQCGSSPAGPNQGVAGRGGYADNFEGQRALSQVELRDMVLSDAEGTRYSWRPGIEHSHPHPVKENPDGTLYYKGKVYRMIGDHGRHNSKNKRRQG